MRTGTHWAFRIMSSTRFHNFLFCPFAVLMLLWLLVELECGGVMLAGLWGCSMGLIWWDVFQCGAPHNDALSSSCLSCFFRGPNRNKIDVELHGSVTSEISCPLFYCFCSPRLYIAVDDPTCCAAVGLNGSMRLYVAYFGEKLAHWYCFACFDVQCAKFSFCCWRHYCFDQLGNVEDSAIVVWVGVVGWHEKMASGTTSGFRFS